MAPSWLKSVASVKPALSAALASFAFPALGAICVALCITLCAGASADTPPATLTLKAKVRDFREGNNSGVANHPNFYGSLAAPACDGQKQGIPVVADNIDTTDAEDPAVFRGDKRGPRLLPNLGAMSVCFSPPADFLDWFNDKDTSVNRPVLIDLPFTYDAATGTYGYDNQAFFPINAGGAWTQVGAAPPFGDLINDGSPNNFGFTLEFHTDFTYQKGKGQVFNFRGDDDVFVFINGKKVIDLGGIHGPETALLNLDSIAASVGITDSNNYPLDFFYAERHCCGSSIRISTSLEFQPLAALPAPVLPPDQSFRDAFVVSLDGMVPGAAYHYTLDGSVPDSASPVYSSPLALSNTATVKVIAIKAGFRNSAVASGTYTRSDDELPAPQVGPAGGFVGAQTVTVTLPGVAGASIRCTQDGSAPDSASPLYAGPFQIAASLTVQCRAYKDGSVPSKVGSAQFTREAAVVHAVYVDENGDGRIDVAVITLDIAPAVRPSALTLTDPFNNQTVTLPANVLKPGSAPNVIVANFSDKPFSPGTAFPTADLGRFPDVDGFGPAAFAIADSAGPVPVSAVAHNKQSPEESPYVDVTFSEPVDLAGLQAGGGQWPFTILRGGVPAMGNVQVTSVQALPGQPDTYRFTFSATSPAYPVYIDSLTLGPDAPATLHDALGNPAVGGGKRIPVTGDPSQVANPILITVTNPITITKDAIYVNYSDQVKDNSIQAVASNLSVPTCLTCPPGIENVFLGPDPIPEWDVHSKYGFHYSFQIFDNLGQFVAKSVGDITSDMIGKLPPGADGFKTLRFRWVPVARDRNKVATGAYILKGLLANANNENQKGTQGEDQTVKGTQTTVLLTFGYLRQK